MWGGGGSNLENWLQNITSETKTPMQSSKDLKREGTNFKKTHTPTRASETCKARSRSPVTLYPQTHKQIHTHQVTKLGQKQNKSPK